MHTESEEERLLTDGVKENLITKVHMAKTAKSKNLTENEAETEAEAEAEGDSNVVEAETERQITSARKRKVTGTNTAGVIKKYTRYRMRTKSTKETGKVAETVAGGLTQHHVSDVGSVRSHDNGQAGQAGQAVDGSLQNRNCNVGNDVGQATLVLLQSLLTEIQKDREGRKQFEEELLSSLTKRQRLDNVEVVDANTGNQIGDIILEHAPTSAGNHPPPNMTVPTSSVTIDPALIRSLAQQVERNTDKVWLNGMKRDYKLTAKNRYDIWYDNLRSELITKGLIGVIEGENEVRSEKEKEGRDFVVRDIIINHIAEEYHSKLLKVDNPRELLKKLKSFKFLECNETSASLKQKLLNIRYNPKRETVFQFWERFEEIITKYNDLPNVPNLPEYDKREAFYQAIIGVTVIGSEIRTLNSLNEERCGQPLTYEQLKTHMLKIEAETNVKEKQAAISAHRAKSKGGARCYECDEIGHISYDCKAPKGWKKCHCCGILSSHRWWNCPKNTDNKDFRQRGQDNEFARNRGNERGKGRGNRYVNKRNTDYNRDIDYNRRQEKSDRFRQKNVGGRRNGWRQNDERFKRKEESDNCNAVHKNDLNKNSDDNKNYKRKKITGKVNIANAEGQPAIHHTTSRNTQGKNFITLMADSGATDHITDRSIKLENFKYSYDEVVKGANDDESADLKIIGRGDMLVTTISPARRNLTLKNVVCTENLSEHLFSLRRCVEAKLAVYLDDEVIEIFDKRTGEIVISGEYRKPYWLIDFELRSDMDKQTTAEIVHVIDECSESKFKSHANILTRSQSKLLNSKFEIDKKGLVSEGENSKNDTHEADKEAQASEGEKCQSDTNTTPNKAEQIQPVSSIPDKNLDIKITGNDHIKLSTLENSLSMNKEKPNLDSLIVDRKLANISDLPTIDLIVTSNCENPLLINQNKILNNDLGMLWHVRLGHPSLKYLQKLQKVDDRLKGVKFNKSILECEVCILAKLEKKPFKTIRERAQQPMQLIHADVMGPISPITHPNRKRFVVVFIDDYSRIAMAYAMKSKAETGEYFDLFLKSMRNVIGFDAKVCYLRSDKGTEFLGGEIQNVLKREGIQNDTSAPHTPQHNGVAERFNRTISQKVRAYMLDSRLPKSIWDLALGAAVYAYNRTPHKSINYEIPYTKVAPNYHVRMDQLKRFGCLAYAKVVSPNTKFSAVAVRCVLVGYIKTGYYLLHPESGKFIESKHVRFRERYVYGDVYENGSIKNWEDQQALDRNVDDVKQWFFVPKAADKIESEQTAVSISNEIAAEPPTYKSRGRPRKRRQELHETDDATKCNKPTKITKTSVDEPECSEHESDHEIEIASDKVEDNSFVNLAHLLNGPTKIYFEKPELELGWNGKPEEDEIKFAMFARLNEDPISYDEAMNSPNASKRREAINEELNSMAKNKVWSLIERPKCMKNGQKLNVIDSRWIFKRKIAKDNSTKYKARLVIRGFKDKNCYDLKETYAPVSRLTLVRAVLAIINKYELFACQLDVKTAFLNGNLDEEIFMQIPEGLNVSSRDRETKICKLEKALYGLRISPKRWNDCFTKVAESIGLKSDVYEPCLFTWREGIKFAILLLYVDDMLIASNDEKKLGEIKLKLNKAFEMSDLGEPKMFLSINIERNREQKILKLSQTAYIDKILERFGFTSSNIQKTPMVTRQVTNKARKDNISVNSMKRKDSCKIQIPFREAVGSLLYLSGSTRPDIAYAVNVLSRRQLAPTEEDVCMLKRIFRYLVGTRELGLRYVGDKNNFEAFSDASFGDCEDRKSTGGFILRLFGDTIGWRSHKQSWVALSTCEAEYVEMSIACQEIITMSWTLLRILKTDMLPAQLWYDNESAGKCVKKTGEHRMKHMADLRFHHVKQCTEEKKVELHWISSANQLADIMTKPLSHVPFLKLRENLLNWC